METQAITQELLELERRFWQAIKDKDAETAMSLTDDTTIVAGASGVGRIDRRSLADMLTSATYTVDAFELDDRAEVRMLSDDVAILAYKVHEELHVDGQPVKLDAADSSTWVRRDGRWLCAAHTEAIAGDPYGRDRH